jgi:hypothetical protein
MYDMGGMELVPIFQAIIIAASYRFSNLLPNKINVCHAHPKKMLIIPSIRIF